jgi:hypothetical protein
MPHPLPAQFPVLFHMLKQWPMLTYLALLLTPAHLNMQPAVLQEFSNQWMVCQSVMASKLMSGSKQMIFG